jgi:hypothetical protein
MVLAVTLTCLGFYFIGASYLGKIFYHATAEQIFSRYLAYPDNNELLRKVTNTQAAELSMGQGVYLRFEVDKGLVTGFLGHDRENPDYNHYPYAPVACGEFFDAYANWADKEFEWWRPQEVESPECLVTRECEYFLFDKDSKTVYYFYFPDFLGKRFYCVNLQGERDTIRR